MKVIEVIAYPSEEAQRKISAIGSRRPGADPVVEAKVLEIIKAVRSEGDAAVLRYTRRFDAPGLEEGRLSVPAEEIEAACAEVDSDFISIVRAAMCNIEDFHKQQLRHSHFITRPDGTFLGQIVRPVRAAGVYIPGGQGGETPLISSVLMNAIPARLAGVSDIAMATPPRKDGSINPYLLAAAHEAGVGRIYRAGSAWGIAALACGTESIRPVDVIVGPGNIFVALAKKILSGEVGIDMIAGPSEILVLADSSARADYIAADLLSQAEHDTMASAICITTSENLAGEISLSLSRQLALLPRSATAATSIQRYGAVFVVKDLDAAFELANSIAPEHLELHLEEPLSWLGKVENAGAVFIGEHTPEPVGDYFAGPNHVLPTAGTARFASALGVDDFLKKTSVIAYSHAAFKRDAESIIRLAELEGLKAHAEAVRIRIGK
ncbi:MAG TPA: histidinol dehydrogenase [Syntrophobacteraceae bacterium]|nr:histidinol dehydrogenase [Syntrophobacteraceae bacterium]